MGFRVLKYLVVVGLLTSSWSRADLPVQEMQAFPPSILLAGGVVQASDGYFYGMTVNGGEYVRGMYAACGTIYRFAPGSKIEIVHEFQPRFDNTLYNIGGGGPKAPLVVGPDGALYGYTTYGGAYSCGGIFRFDLNGTFTPLLDLDQNLASWAGLQHMIVSKTGDIYAISLSSGDESTGGGKFFRIRDGQVQLLHTFQYSEGWQEGDYVAPDHPNFLVEGADGRIYGTTTRGGVVGPRDGWYDRMDGPGVVFRLEDDGTLTFFDGFEQEGDQPHYLIPNPDGSFYGTNAWGIVRMSPDMEVTQIWETTRLNRYGVRIPAFRRENSERPILGSDGAFYFARQESVFHGRIFKLTLQGALTPLHELSPDYFDYWGSGLTEGNDGFLYFISAWKWTPGGDFYSPPSLNRYALATTADTTLSRTQAFRLKIADPLNGDQPPLALADHVVLKKGKKGLLETSVSVLANDWDPDGDVLTIVSASSPQYGNVRIDDGVLYYTPNNPKDIRTDECRYVVTDGKGGISSATVTFRAPLKGRYAGRLRAVGTGRRAGGTYAVSVAANGKVTGRISIGNKTYPIKGQLGADDRIGGSFRDKGKKGSVVEAALGLVFTPKRKFQGEVRLVNATNRVTYQLR